MGMAERLQGKIDELALSHAALAKRVGVSTQTIWKLANGHSNSSSYLHKIARELGTTPEYLEGETDDPSPVAARRDALKLVPAETDDAVEIDSIDLAYGMGGTFVDDNAVEVEKVRFSRTWLRHFTDTPPDHLFSTQGSGDSMYPTIHDRDVLIIDRSQRTLVDQMSDKVWAVMFGEVGMIKRLRPMPDGTVKILSDNQAIPPEVATDGDLFIVGRVVAKVSRM